MFGQSHKTKWTWDCDVTYPQGSTFSLVLSVKQLFLGLKFISHLKCDYKQPPGWYGTQNTGYYDIRDTHYWHDQRLVIVVVSWKRRHFRKRKSDTWRGVRRETPPTPAGSVYVQKDVGGPYVGVEL